METPKLAAEPRSEAGTGAAKRLRREGKIPAVVYGEGGAEPIVLDDRTFRHATHGRSLVTIYDLAVAGGKASTAIIKEIQRHPLRDEILHVDLQRIGMNERIHAALPVHLTGEPVGVKMGGVMQHALWEVEISALAKDMPAAVQVDVSELNVGDSIPVSALEFPEGVDVLTSPEAVVVSVLAPTIHREEVPVEEEEVEEEAAAAEGEKPAEGAEAAEAARDAQTEG